MLSVHATCAVGQRKQYTSMCYCTTNCFSASIKFVILHILSLSCAALMQTEKSNNYIKIAQQQGNAFCVLFFMFQFHLLSTILTLSLIRNIMAQCLSLFSSVERLARESNWLCGLICSHPMKTENQLLTLASAIGSPVGQHAFCTLNDSVKQRTDLRHLFKPFPSTMNCFEQTHLVVLYRPYSHFLEEFGEFLSDVATHSDGNLIIGDFNINVNKAFNPSSKQSLSGPLSLCMNILIAVIIPLF